MVQATLVRVACISKGRKTAFHPVFSTGAAVGTRHVKNPPRVLGRPGVHGLVRIDVV